MEEFDSELDNHLTNGSDITLTASGKNDFKTIANWCLFFSILGILFSLLLFIGGLSMSAVMNAMPGMGSYGGIVTAIYIIMALIFVVPVYYLMKFSSKMKSALSKNSAQEFNLAINKLKMHFLVMGIFTLIVIILYVILILAMAGGMASGMANEWAL